MVRRAKLGCARVRQKRRTTGNIWAVCLDMMRQPTEWGCVLSLSKGSVTVKGEEGGWDSPYWTKSYVELYATKEECKRRFDGNWKAPYGCLRVLEEVETRWT